MITKRNILVTGGLGFIGSHTVLCLNEAGYTPIIVDNLHNSRIEVLDALEELLGYRPTYIQGDVNDGSLMMKVFNEYTPSAVIHFAAHKAVGESVEKPLMYYQNNVVGLISLLEVMKSTGCVKMVFSSSCTVYGEPESVPVRESTPTRPAASPYGATKQMAEVILKDNAWCEVQCLRYFNPVGAHPSAKIGELPLGVPNNLIPYLTQTVAGIREKLTVHGGDYPTADGTCIRDYIHVADLADSHLSALKRVESEMVHEAYNVGSGKGYSVKEMIEQISVSMKRELTPKICPRRSGDIPQLIASISKIERELGWKPKRSLKEMIDSAWQAEEGNS